MADPRIDPFGALTTVDLPEGPTSFYRIGKLEEDGIVDSLDRLPFSIRILLLCSSRCPPMHMLLLSSSPLLAASGSAPQVSPWEHMS